jgi:diguanylate cyclase (GGDEF)-like protein
VHPIEHPDHEVGGLYVVALLSYVRRACGEAAVSELETLIGGSLDDLPDESGWLSLDRMHELADAAVRVTGVSDIGRMVGVELFERGKEQGIDQLMRSAGGPVEAFEMFVALGSRFAGAWTLEVTETGDHHVAIESRAAVPVESAFWCGSALGYYPLVPGVFGLRATAAHPRCLVRGDDRCRYVVRWEDAEARRTGPSYDAIAHVEHLQATAARLATAPDPESVVKLAADLANNVMLGRRFLVDATLGSPDRRVVAHHGFDDLDAVDLARTRIEADDPADRWDEGDEQVCVARLEVGGDDYGWIASLHPPRSTIDGFVERPLASFAHHLASAIHAALLLESAEHDRDTARALVGFARDLAGVTRSSDVADLVEAALVASTTCVDARVWLLDPEDQVLRHVGWRAHADDQLSPVDGATLGPAMRLVRHRAEIDRLHLGSEGLECSAVMPLVARGEVLGMVATGWSRPSSPTGDELARVEGIVDQAALAFDVVRLVADLERQARHDPLTGLANRALLAERAELAMAHAQRSGHQVGLLFVDLDRFKSVNDAFGHSSGDEVICEVADRLRGIVRTTDTVARLGGDEFVVLLTECADVDDAVVAANRVSEVMATPFVVGGGSLAVSATVGVHAAPPGDLTWHALLDRADAAMYRGKQNGRSSVAVG